VDRHASNGAIVIPAQTGAAFQQLGEPLAKFPDEADFLTGDSGEKRRAGVVIEGMMELSRTHQHRPNEYCPARTPDAIPPPRRMSFRGAFMVLARTGRNEMGVKDGGCLGARGVRSAVAAAVLVVATGLA